jgi:hypothetical protein
MRIFNALMKTTSISSSWLVRRWNQQLHTHIIRLFDREQACRLRLS